MALKTKSIQKKASKTDGLRICIMRRPGETDTDWDLWLPRLSPPTELLDAYKYGGLEWEAFCTRFKKEVIKKHKKLCVFLAELARTQDVTLLCWEETPDKCHRKLVLEECLRLAPDLETRLK